MGDRSCRCLRSTPSLLLAPKTRAHFLLSQPNHSTTLHPRTGVISSLNTKLESSPSKGKDGTRHFRLRTQPSSRKGSTGSQNQVKMLRTMMAVTVQSVTAHNGQSLGIAMHDTLLQLVHYQQFLIPPRHLRNRRRMSWCPWSMMIQRTYPSPKMTTLRKS
jgi:hypothetical protein